MNLSESSVEPNRLRLPSRIESAIAGSGFNAISGYIFGIILIGAGSAMVLNGVKVISVSPVHIHSQNWFLIIFGVYFIGGGLFLWARAYLVQRLEKKRKILTTQHPGSEAFADYPWDPRGTTKSTATPAVKSVAKVTLFILFLLPFNWLAWFSSENHIMFKIFVSVFDFFILLAVIETVRLILVALKYGDSRLDYNNFPAWTGERLGLKWIAPKGLEKAETITFILRCIEEWTEWSGSGKNRSKKFIHEQLWAAKKVYQGHSHCPPGMTIPLSFDLPDHTDGSDLNDKELRTCWELEVVAETPGVDFQERYLVPIYSRD